MREMDIILNLNELEFDTDQELTEAVIRKRWKDLSKLYHPDVNDNEIFQNSKKQQKINVAKDFLIENLDAVNEYIRKQNYRPSEEEIKRAAKEKEEQARKERERQAAEEAARKAKEEAARKAREEAARKAKAEAEKKATESANKRTSTSTNSYSSSSYSSSSYSSSGSSSSYGSSSYSGNSYSSSYSSGSSYSSHAASRTPPSKKSKIVFYAIIVVIALLVVLSIVLTTTKSCVSATGKKISTPDELRAIVEEPDKNYRLTQDIDLEGMEWKPIADFKGTLDGCGYTIKNLKITQFDSEYIGLFATISEGAEIKNLKIEGLDIDSFNSAKGIGGIVGLSKGKVSDCSVQGKINTAGVNCVGGVVGLLEYGNNGTINCSFDGSIIGNTGVGGIVGYGAPATITGCTSKGDINGISFVGGIYGGYTSVNATSYEIKNCTNSATITCSGDNAGGIVGRAYSSNNWGTPTLELSGCTNSGTVTGSNYTGGIAGYASTHTYNVEPSISGHQNDADITGKNYTGGIIGCCGNTITLSAVSSNGKIIGEDYVGSIAGSMENAEITGVTNNSEVRGRCYVGGIAGRAKTISNCTNNAAVYASGAPTSGDGTVLGGIVGSAKAVKNSKNTGKVEADIGTKVGGIMGCNAPESNVEITNSTNEGNIIVNQGANIGGIVGIISTNNPGTTEISGCVNRGNITLNEPTSAEASLGGVLGRYRASPFWAINLNISSCQVLAGGLTVSNSKAIVGGVVGSSENGTMVISVVNVDTTISAAGVIGSIVGRCNNFNNISTYSNTYTLSNGVKSLPMIAEQ